MVMSSPHVTDSLANASSGPVHDEGIDILEVLIVLARDKRRIGFITLACLLIGVLIAFLLKPTYTAKASILPPQQPHSSASALLGQLGGELGTLAALGGTGGILKNPADLYVGMLESRTVSDNLVDRFHLEAVYKVKTMDDARRDLKKHVKVEAAKDGLIDISVEDHDPRRASEMANGLISGLHQLTSNLAMTDDAQRRLFFSQQMDEEKSALAAAEEDLKKTQEKTGLIQLSDQAQAIIRNVAELRAELVEREVQMQSMHAYATDANPEVERLQQQIDALRQQLASLENNQRQVPRGDIEIPTGQVPEVGLEYIRKLREVTFHTALLNLLSREYEAARLDEAKSVPLIQVVDPAVPPAKKSGPHRILLIAAAGILGFVIGCLWAFIRHSLRRIEQIPENSEKLRELRSALGLQRNLNFRIR